MRLYLVRRNLEEYIGPMSLIDLKSAYGRMDFGLEDEVASHLGKWIRFDNLGLLKQTYPEVSQIMKLGIKENWGQHQQSIHSGVKLKKNNDRKKSKRRRRSSSIKFVFAFVCLMLILGGGYVLYENEDLTAKLLGVLDSYNTDQVEKMLLDPNPKAFDTYMNTVMPSLVSKVSKSRSEYNTWIPYLRYWAYRHDGKINGVKAKLLRGMGQFSAPTDCSVDAWQSRWLEDNSNWNAFLNGETIGTSAWSKLLLWDPNWIKKRNNVEGWQKPLNYYEACLVTAQKSLETLDDGWYSTTQNQDVIKKFSARIKMMLAIVHNENPSFDQKANDTLTNLGCLDAADTKEELALCASNNSHNDIWKNYRNIRKARAESRILLQSKYNIALENLVLLSKLQDTTKSKDEYTEFDYSAESKFITILLLNNGSIKDSVKKLSGDFPEVDFER